MIFRIYEFLIYNITFTPTELSFSWGTKPHAFVTLALSFSSSFPRANPATRIEGKINYTEALP